MDSVHYNPCPVCEENFTWGNTMRNHIVDGHGNDKEHQHNDDLDNNADGVLCDGLVFKIIDANDFTTLQEDPEKQCSMKIKYNVCVTLDGNSPEQIVNLRKQNKGR